MEKRGKSELGGCEFAFFLLKKRRKRRKKKEGTLVRKESLQKHGDSGIRYLWYNGPASFHKEREL